MVDSSRTLNCTGPAMPTAGTPLHSLSGVGGLNGRPRSRVLDTAGSFRRRGVRDKQSALNRKEPDFENVVVADAHVAYRFLGRQAIHVDPRHRRLRSLEDHVLGFLNVDA